MNNLPDDLSVPFEVNGIHFSNLEDYKVRIEHDAEQIAKLIYDIYRDEKQRERLSELEDQKPILS